MIVTVLVAGRGCHDDWFQQIIVRTYHLASQYL